MVLVLLGGTAAAQDPFTDNDLEDAIKCHLLVSVTAGGAVQLAQVAETSGSAMLDGSCMNSTIMNHLKPDPAAPSVGNHWVMLTIRAVFKLPHKEAQAAQAHTAIPIPVISQAEPFTLTHHRESAGDAPRPSPVCAAHAVVSASGSVDSVGITISTGSPRWDDACLNAIRSLSFSPGLRDGQPVTAPTDIWINWQAVN
jgi:TonB family protein